MSGLTKQQERAMLAFLYHKRYEDEACDGAVWDRGVRPWPTMANLVTKGLVEREGWYGPDEGWNWRLTDAGRAYMQTVVSARAEGEKP